MTDAEERIILGATEQFRIHGLQFTVQDIAGSIHMSKKTIYKYYNTKHDLMMAIVAYAFEKIHKVKDDILASDESTVEKLRKLIIALPEEYQMLDFRQLSGLKVQYPEIDAEVRRQLETGWGPTTRLLEQAIANGEIRPISLPIFRTMIVSTIEAFLSTDGLKEEGITYQEALQNMIDLLIDGVRRNDA
jgi:AcrR family transcriptional regulator